MAVSTLAPEHAALLLTQAADAGVYAMLAIGLNLVVGYAGVLDLGYAAFFAIGAYTYAALASDHGLVTPLQLAIHLPFWLVVVVAGALTAVCGVGLGSPALRVRGDYLAIVTLGFGEIVPRVLKNADQWTSGVNGIAGLDAPVVPLWPNPTPEGLVLGAPMGTPLASYVVMLALVGASATAAHNLHHSRIGRAWAAVRDDEIAAAASGVNVVAARLWAFAIGAAISGVAGTFFAAKLSLVSPENFSVTVSITILVMVVLGGMGSVSGVIVGALLIYVLTVDLLSLLPVLVGTFFDSTLRGFFATDIVTPDATEVIQRLPHLVYGTLLIVVMLLRPRGLLPPGDPQP